MRLPCRCRDHAILASRRDALTGLASAVAVAAVPALARAADTQTRIDDERFMRMALAEARRADFPFGAVIVRDGAVLARGRNLGRSTRDPTAHGEMVAIRRLIAAGGGGALRGTTLYTTGEPCAMCMGAILWSRIARLVFAASVKQLATRIDQIMLSSEEVAATAKFAPIVITSGVLADEAMALFKNQR
jgi:tRNA(Arg) A34 adenosine deaminase TadA